MSDIEGLPDPLPFLSARPQWDEDPLELHDEGFTPDEIEERVSGEEDESTEIVHDGSWHDDALTLSDQGFTQSEIADRCGVSQQTVSKYLTRVKDGSSAELHDIAVEYDLVQPHRTRTPRQILVDPATKRAALEAFARGDITRDELMRRITL